MRFALAPVAFLLTSALLAAPALSQFDLVREWSDSTGRFKIQASLLEQRDGDVFLKTSDGKTMKIPVNRLSAADQEFLQSGNNPFEVVSSSPSPSPSLAPNPTVTANSSTSPTSGGAAIDSGNAPLPWSAPWQIDWEQVEQSLRAAASQAGYQLVPNAPIAITASIKGPEQEAVSYIARGSYIATKYTTTVQLVWNGKHVWSKSGNNIPGFLQTRADETIQQKLDELGKQPNLAFFNHVGFPKILQAPKENQAGHNNHNALLISKFTLQGLVDSQ